MKEGQASRTAVVVAIARAVYAELPAPYRSLDDPDAADLLGPGYGAAIRRFGRSRAGGWLAHHGFGAGLLGLMHHIALRTLAIDDALMEAYKAGVRQVVLLGSGLDNRPRRLADRVAGTRFFAVDHPSSLALRKERMRAPSGRVDEVLVDVDFERQSFAERLRHAELDPSKPSFWVWEGVTPYLTEVARQSSIRSVADLSAADSRIAITYARPETGTARDRLLGVGLKVFRALGEPALGFIGSIELASELAAAKGQTVSDEGISDWSKRYWPDLRASRWEWERLLIAKF